MRQESLMKEQAVRIENFHQEEFCGSRQQFREQLWEQKGGIESFPGNEGRIAQARVNVRGALRVFSVLFCHSEGWTPRNEALLEAVLKQARTTGHPWLVACDANMCPEDFEKSLWFQRERRCMWWT